MKSCLDRQDNPRFRDAFRQLVVAAVRRQGGGQEEGITADALLEVGEYNVHPLLWRLVFDIKPDNMVDVTTYLSEKKRINPRVFAGWFPASFLLYHVY